MEDTDQNKLFIGGISWETTIDVLRDHFAKYGAVMSSIVAKDRITGNPRGFAFVAFSESSAVDRALQDSHQILNRTVEVKRAIPRGELHSHQQQHHNRGFNMNNFSKITGNNRDQYRTKKIFVGGLSADLTDEEFRNYFAKFGRITDVVVMYDNITHRPRGFGFITFDSEDSVEEVMQKNFHELTGKLVEVKRAVPKDANNSTNTGYNGRVTNERSPNFNFYPQGSNSPYNPSFGYFPFGYGNVPMYPYGAGFQGYGLSPMAPRGPPWSPAMVGVRGGLFPYGGGAPVYPAYINGGSGVMGLAANGYGGILGNGDAQSAGESTQTARDSMIVNSYGYGRGTGVAGSKQNQNSYNKSYPTYSSS